jgi:NarL family two-component system response regulator LiaR
MPEKITVFIVDDHAVVRQGIRTYLALQPDVELIGEAAEGEGAITQVTELIPDVLLVDLIMPGLDGVEVARRVKQLSPHTQIVVLTSYHEDEHIFPALRAGALSYVLKDIAPDELVAVIQKAARGEAVLHPQVAARVVREIQGSRGSPPNPFLELSERELEVLRLIADGASNALIADKLCISEKTVKGHVSNILGKLHIEDRTQAAVLAWRQGLMRRDQTS